MRCTEEAGVTQRSVAVGVPEAGPRMLTQEEFDQLGTMEKWRALREKRFVDPRTAGRVRRAGPAVIAYLSVTAPITMNLCVLPHHFGGDDAADSSLLLWRVVFSFIAVQTVANWCLLLVHDPRLRSKLPAPPQVDGRACAPPVRASKAQFLWSYEADGRTGLRWRWCRRCETHLPPRGHHCAICDRCVLQRDRHCFFTGNCIGFSNQRFFAPFALYAFLVCLAVLRFSPAYLSARLAARDASWLWPLLLPPWAVLQALTGRLAAVELVVLTQLWVVSWGWLLCLVFFLVQTACNLLGRTTFEIHTSDAILRPRNGVLVRLPVAERMRRVHGRLWALNFLLPMHWAFPTPQDGVEQPGVVDRTELLRLQRVAVE